MYFKLFYVRNQLTWYFLFCLRTIQKINCREWKERFDLVDNDEEDTLTYHYKNIFKFRPDLGSLTGDEIITMPHPCMHNSIFLSFVNIFLIFSFKLHLYIVITSALLTLNIDKKSFLPLVNSAIDVLFNSPQDVRIISRISSHGYQKYNCNCYCLDVLHGKSDGHSL